MPRQHKNKKLLSGGLSRSFLLMLLAAALLGGCGKKKSKPAPPAAEPVSQPATKPAIPQDEPIRSERLGVMVLVNDNRYAVLPCDVPVYVQYVIENPLDDTVKLVSVPPVPRIIGEDDKEVSGKWKFCPSNLQRVEAGKIKVMNWFLESQLSPGKYRIVLPQDAKLIADDLKTPETKISSAGLEITDDKASPEILAYYKRRLLAMQGSYEQLLSELDKAIKLQPQELSLQGERMDALEFLGRYEDALEQLHSMAMQMQAKSKDKMHPVPDWVVFREMRLQKMMENNARKKENTK